MKKAGAVIKTIVIWALVIFAVGIMLFTILSVATFDRSDRSIFGYKAFIVLSDSMSATDFSAGDIVLVKEVDPTALQEGDIISYRSQNTDNYGETVTHKIRRITTDANGERGFITYGTTTDADDETVVTASSILGQYQFCVPKVGYFFRFLKTTPGYICYILLPFLLLIGLRALDTVQLFRRYKKEQSAELASEREAIETARAENAKMLAELQALKAQMAAPAEAAAPISEAPAPAPDSTPPTARVVETNDEMIDRLISDCLADDPARPL